MEIEAVEIVSWSLPHRLSIRRVLIGSAGVLLLAACVPPPTPPSPPNTSIPPASCDTSAAAPTPSNPVTYVAVVDKPGPGAPTVTTFTATSQEQKDQKVQDLQATGTVVALEEDKPVHALAVDPSNDPASPAQWGLSAANFPAAWANGYDGTGVRIAIVDTGVRGTHEDLLGRVMAGYDFQTNAAIAPGANSDLANSPSPGTGGHGTHVAGIAAAADNTTGGLGGAPSSTIVPVRVLNSLGDGTDSTVAAGILWAADPSPTKGHAQVINLSLGGPDCSTTIEAALQYAHDQHVVVVAAAGNGATSAASSPAAYNDEVIAVAATNRSGDLAAYSNYGTYVDLAAPGGDGNGCSTSTPQNTTMVYSTYNSSITSYWCLSGTSMASPLVAAAAALLVQKCPGILPDTVRAKLMAYAGTVVAPHYTFRRLDAGGAITAGVSCS